MANGFVQDALDRAVEPSTLLDVDLICERQRVNAGCKQRLVCINISDSRNESLIEQGRFNCTAGGV